MKTSATEEAAASAMKTSTREGDDDDETGIDRREAPDGIGRRSRSRPASLPSIALPSFALPSVSLPDLRDAEIEWHSQTNPDNDSRVDYDATVALALGCSFPSGCPFPKTGRCGGRETRRRRGQCGETVDDLKRDDDVDRTIGPT